VPSHLPDLPHNCRVSSFLCRTTCFFDYQADGASNALRSSVHISMALPLALLRLRGTEEILQTGLLFRLVGHQTSSMSCPPTYDAHKNIRWYKTRWCALGRCGFGRPCSQAKAEAGSAIPSSGECCEPAARECGAMRPKANANAECSPWAARLALQGGY
jgi:hypothetical protein